MARCSKKIILFSFLVLFCAGDLLAKAGSTRTSPVKYIWTVTLKHQSFLLRNPFQFARPVLDETMIFVGVAKGYFYGIDAKRGRKRWTFKTQGSVYSKGAVGEKSVFFGDYKGYVYALDKVSGKLLWSSSLRSSILSAPVLVDSKVYFINARKQISVLNAETGQLLWETLPLAEDNDLSLFGNADPLYANNKIFVGFSDGMLIAFDAQDGTIVWSKQLGDRGEFLHDIDAQILLVNNVLYVPVADGHLYALKPDHGETLWEINVGGANAPIFFEDRLFLSAGGTLYSIDAKEGRIFWEQNLEIPALSSPVLLGNYLVTVATRGKMYFVKRESGDLFYARFFTKGSFSHPVVSGNRLYVLSNRGRLVCFELRKEKK